MGADDFSDEDGGSYTYRDDDEDIEVDVVNDDEAVTPSPPTTTPPPSNLPQGAFINPAAVLKNITNQAPTPIKKENDAISTKKPVPVVKKPSSAAPDRNKKTACLPPPAEVKKKTPALAADKKPVAKNASKRQETRKKTASARKAEVLKPVQQQQQQQKVTKAKAKKGKAPRPAILVKHGRQSTGGVVQTSALDGMRCHVCNYACEQRAKLMAHFEKAHIRRSKDNLDYQCAHCDYVTPLKVVLKSHIITQHAK